MNTLDADWDPPATLLDPRLHTARRLVGILGGILFFVLLAAGIWGIRAWEYSARQQEQAALAQAEAANQEPTPPQPTFATAGMFEGGESGGGESSGGFSPRDPEGNPLNPVVLPHLLLSEAPTFAEGVIDHPISLAEPALRSVYAPRDAVVQKIHVKTDQVIKPGDLLMELSSFDLEWQMLQVRKDLDLAEAKLSALLAKKIRFGQLIERDAITQDQLVELTAELQSVQVELETRKNQWKLLQREQSQLKLRAPIEGVVLTTHVEAVFTDKPVRRGEMLLEIGPISNPPNPHKDKPKTVKQTPIENP